ncbi:MAG: hypothetical protein QOK34_299 [Gaiellaceae bacterium]|jgi:hypothetical protein|nr:hypothetical protein [Gaiellaceae bacterium]
MRATTPIRTSLIAVLLAAPALLLPANPALAATATRLTDTHAVFYQFGPDDDLCFHSPSTVTGTSEFHGELVELPSGGLHFSGQEVFTSTIVYANPAFLPRNDRQIENTAFNATRGGTTVFTQAVNDRATATDGSAVMVHGVFHFVVNDLPPAGPSPNDTVRVDFSTFQFTCPA